ncbi:MAG: rhodanese-like domain-containing protein [Frankiaceae bacterium]|nr:rhodanese-like domain-containing protein [Frankiaceae bacterium]MBV9869559.1 rhodanese-like domain-containing protein [Frankiaceae bacterium]
MPREISVMQAAQLVEAGDAVLLDVREPDEWRFVRAPAATHIPMRQVGAALDQLPAGPTIACICHVGGRSAVVADALEANGYDAVNVVGGMDAWEAAGLPVERG